jgi:hypothetical protein
VYRRFVEGLDRLAPALTGSRLVIVGAGIRGCCLLRLLEGRGYRDIVFCDNNPQKQGGTVGAYPILSFPEALALPGPRRMLAAPENAGDLRRQLAAAGLAEGVDWFSFDVSVYEDYLAEYARPAAGHLLVLGDCAFTHVGLGEAPPLLPLLPLGEMLKQALGPGRCKVLALHGMGPGGFYPVLMSLLDRGETPGACLVLLGDWMMPKAHLMPRAQHPALLRALAAALPHPRAEFLDYIRLAQERFDRLRAEPFAAPAGHASREKLYMAAHYLYTLREDAEGVVYLLKILRALREAAVPCVLYVPPVPYQLGEDFFGPGFRAGYQANFARLFALLEGQGLACPVADASFLLSREEFAAPNTVDEVANAQGRRKLALFLAEFFLKKFPL